MNHLFQHIEYLLLRHDCVIVPGLGAFIVSTAPATINMEMGMIVPPSRRLMFNQAVAIDDGLLANSYARKTGLSFEEARKALARDVAVIKDRLLRDRMLECGSIGTLILSDDGRPVFSPAPRHEDILFPSAANLRKKVVSRQPASTAATSEATDESMDEEKGRPASRFSLARTIVRMGAACLVFAAVAIAIISHPIPHDEREERASIIPVEAFITEKSTESETTQKADSASLPQPEQAVMPETDPKHYLIVATFRSHAEAEKYAESYSTDRFRMQTVDSRRMSRVAVASSDSRDSLRRQLNSPSFRKIFPQAWIWSRE